MATATRSRTSDFVALTKPRLNLLVVATTAGGYFMGAAPEVTALGLLNVTLATALVAGGSAAFNQVMERKVDALMDRTRRRPVAEGRLSPRESLVFATRAVARRPGLAGADDDAARRGRRAGHAAHLRRRSTRR